MASTLVLEAWQVATLELLEDKIYLAGSEQGTYVVSGITVSQFLDQISLLIDQGDQRFITFPASAGITIKDFVQNILIKNGLAANEPLSTQITLGRPLGPHDGYSFILDFISTKNGGGLEAERNSDQTFFQPLSGVDEFVWVFLDGARATNLSSNRLAAPTAFGLMGENYNNIQYNLRFQDQIDSSETQNASNEIARLILSTVISEAKELSPIPTLFHLGQEDGQVGARRLWSVDAGPLSIGQEIGGWAGTPFFTLLRTPEFFQRDILYYKSNGDIKSNDPQIFSVVTDKNDIVYRYATTYDMLALIVAFSKASQIATGATGLDDAWNDFFGALNGAGGTIDFINSGLEARQELIKANAFFEQSYGLIYDNTQLSLDHRKKIFGGALVSDFDRAPGALSLFSNEYAYEILGSRVVVGKNGRDVALSNDVIAGDAGISGQFRTTFGNDVINAGRGDDLIISDGGKDTIDGGRDGVDDPGFDTVDYRKVENGVRVSIFNLDGLGYQNVNVVGESFVATVNQAGYWLEDLFTPFSGDVLYDIEKIVGSGVEDTFLLNRLTRDLELDGSGGGDWLSFELHDGPLFFEFRESGLVLPLELNGYLDFLKLDSVEGIAGSELNDLFIFENLTPKFGDNAFTRFDGRDGFDVADFSFSSSKIDANLFPVVNGEAQVGPLEFINFEQIIGSDDNNFVYGRPDTVPTQSSIGSVEDRLRSLIEAPNFSLVSALGGGFTDFGTITKISAGAGDDFVIADSKLEQDNSPRDEGTPEPPPIPRAVFDVLGEAGNDILISWNPLFVEATEAEGNVPATASRSVVVNGGLGNDYVMIVFGERALTIGGSGRDWIFNTSAHGVIYGDTFDGLGANGEKVDWEEKVPGEDGSSTYLHADKIWFRGGTTMMDPTKADSLSFYGYPLVGGTNDLGSFVGGSSLPGLGFGLTVASALYNPYYFDYFLPFVTYYIDRKENTLSALNMFGVLLSGVTLDTREPGEPPTGVMRFENYDESVETYFGASVAARSFYTVSTGDRSQLSDMGMLFKRANPLLALFALIPGFPGGLNRLGPMIDDLLMKAGAAALMAKSVLWSTGTDPLILDLDGDGIETISLDDADVWFDLDNDLFGERTGWLSGDDGFLVRDLNQNGQIDGIAEMFGGPGQSGLAMLAAFDDNGDGRIDAADAIRTELRVWRDFDGDGVTDAGELFTLDALGIVTLNLATTNLNVTTPQGTLLEQSAEITFANGSVSRMFDAI